MKIINLDINILSAPQLKVQVESLNNGLSRKPLLIDLQEKETLILLFFASNVTMHLNNAETQLIKI